MLFQFAEAIDYHDYLGQLPAELHLNYRIRASLHICFNSVPEFQSLMQESTWKNSSFNQLLLAHIQKSVTLLSKDTGNKANNQGLLCLLKKGKRSRNGSWPSWSIPYSAEIISKKKCLLGRSLPAWKLCPDLQMVSKHLYTVSVWSWNRMIWDKKPKTSKKAKSVEMTSCLKQYQQ